MPQWDAEHTFPTDVVLQMGDLGCSASNSPRSTAAAAPT